VVVFVAVDFRDITEFDADDASVGKNVGAADDSVAPFEVVGNATDVYATAADNADAEPTPFTGGGGDSDVDSHSDAGVYAGADTDSDDGDTVAVVSLAGGVDVAFGAAGLNATTADDNVDADASAPFRRSISPHSCPVTICCTPALFAGGVEVEFDANAPGGGGPGECAGRNGGVDDDSTTGADVAGENGGVDDDNTDAALSGVNGGVE
jgi:hypothetical protein